MNNYLLLIALSERDKRILIALLIVVILIFIFIGLIYKALKKISNNLGKKIDFYVMTLKQNGIITSPKEAIACVRYKEKKRLYTFNRWIIRVCLICFCITIFIFTYRYNSDYSLMSKTLDQLKLRIYWPRGSFFGIDNFIIDWPSKVIYPAVDSDLASILTYINVLMIIVLFIHILYSFMVYRGCIIRIKKCANGVFGFDLDQPSLTANNS